MSENVGQSYIARASGLKGKDYVSYALGDTGCCLAFGLVTTLLQRFYTDVLLLHPLFIMLMFVAARVWDAINDPITNSSHDWVVYCIPYTCYNKHYHNE